MTDKERAARIRECVGIFSRGCSNTLDVVEGKITAMHPPEECEECTAEFLKQVRKALD